MQKLTKTAKRRASTKEIIKERELLLEAMRVAAIYSDGRIKLVETSRMVH